MSGDRIYGVDDLLGAYLQKWRWSRAHPDLRDYHARRYAALAAALGADLDHPSREGAGAEVSRPSWYAGLAAERPDIFPASWSELCERQESALADLLHSTIRQAERLGSPFDGYFEAPRVVQAFHSEHAAEVRRLLDELRAGLIVLLREVTCTLWSLDPSATVTAGALRERGFDPDRPAPDPIAYWRGSGAARPPAPPSRNASSPATARRRAAGRAFGPLGPRARTARLLTADYSYPLGPPGQVSYD